MDIKRFFALILMIGAFMFGAATIMRATVYMPDSGVSGITAVGSVPTAEAKTITTSSSIGSGEISASADTASTPDPIPAEDPVRLIIPSIKVNAAVQYTGVNSKGNIGTPSNFTDVAWYDKSPAPGETGVAIIDGHVDNGLALAGVFKHLDEISPNDDIYVTEKDGTKLHFVVTSVSAYPYTDPNAASAILNTSAADPELDLITCTGSWVSGDKTYDHRLVVSAKLVQ